MKRVFVTGASGFIGAALVKRLVAQNISVAVLQSGKTPGRRLAAIADKLRFIERAKGTTESLRDSLLEWAPDTVFHLGWGGVSNVDRNDAALQSGNVAFTVELAQMCVACGVEQFVGAGSQAEYGKKDSQIAETECPAPTTLYGAAKLSSCFLSERICELEGVRHAWLRIFSTYGPDDNPDWMLPSLIRKLSAGERPPLTLGEQQWDYLYVDDAAAAFIAAAAARINGIYNLGSGKAVSLRALIETVRDKIDPKLELGFGEVAYRPDQVMHLEANIEKLRATSGWSPEISLSDGLAETTRWFGSNKNAV